ncbi:hypothetical protein ACR71G_11060 [Xenorhabdus bovienii]|uniref:Uncharacterized protein n=1 Tax=Xenorhabdus bovienii str. kraussei Becker Underwood TaxID=1398204 RepID=A0A077PXT0_XENBV|nr:hypothetical protein [Xenorhabdus bovienii]CDH25472.1 hypothetical protein XBKB1_4060001 [Xenorhabdus bovienii str. kraussei Becker Underwood]
MSNNNEKTELVNKDKGIYSKVISIDVGDINGGENIKPIICIKNINNDVINYYKLAFPEEEINGAATYSVILAAFSYDMPIILKFIGSDRIAGVMIDTDIGDK